MYSDQFKSLQMLIAQNLGIEASAITLSASLNEDLGADSLDALHLLAAINQEFNTNIAQDEVEKIKTVSDLWELIQVEK